jgi:tetratricopeptide (TPR) repeat protein
MKRNLDAEAEPAIRQALVLREELLSEFPDGWEYRLALTDTLCSLGDVLKRAARYVEAEAAYRRALAVQEDLVADYPAQKYFPTSRAVVEYHLGRLLEDVGRTPEAAERYRRIVPLLADRSEKVFLTGRLGGEGLSHLAWFLATCPAPELRDPVAAVELATAALDWKEGRRWRSLGVALYRKGDWQPALEALMKAEALQPVRSASTWFFLAMTHWQRGDKEQARQWYDKAVQWMDKNMTEDEELHRFRTEAASLLGIKGQLVPEGKEDSPHTPP